MRTATVYLWAVADFLVATVVVVACVGIIGSLLGAFRDWLRKPKEVVEGIKQAA